MCCVLLLLIFRIDTKQARLGTVEKLHFYFTVFIVNSQTKKFYNYNRIENKNKWLFVINNVFVSEPNLKQQVAKDPIKRK